MYFGGPYKAVGGRRSIMKQYVPHTTVGLRTRSRKALEVGHMELDPAFDDEERRTKSYK